MPVPYLTTSYGWIVHDLMDLTIDLERIQINSIDKISEVEAALCHFYLEKILKSLILATGIGRREWHPLANRCNH